MDLDATYRIDTRVPPISESEDAPITGTYHCTFDDPKAAKFGE
jgi:hypothetical protein